MKHTYKVLIVSFFAFLCCITTINANTNSACFTNNEGDEPQRFIVYYEGDLTKLMGDKSSYLLSFLEAYSLELINTFEIDENNRGFTLLVKENGSIPTELARELSMIDGVVMVEIVKESAIKSET